MSISCIETLSNEIFHEIFDYLDGYDIFNAFSNLNNRFEQFLHCSTFLYKNTIHYSLDETCSNKCQQLQYLNRHQIFSISLDGSCIKTFFSTFIIDSSLDRLESISLQGIKRNKLLLLLKNFFCLPRLFSLNIQFYDTSTDLTEVYRLIFTLPVLKYIQIRSSDLNGVTSLPMVTKNQQLSPIKYLVIDHGWKFNELDAILSYTPELCHLSIQHQSNMDSKIEMILPITLSNLKYLSIGIDHLDYDEMMKFIKKIICSNLKVFHLTIQSFDIVYLVSTLWERFILEYIPNLEKFYFNCSEPIDYENQSRKYYWKENQFTSSFWIQRKWIFQAEIDTHEINYSIHPYRYIDDNKSLILNDFFPRNTWYESEQNDTSSILTINDTYFEGYRELLFENIILVTTITSIYHLEFCQPKISVRILMKIVYLLPDVDSLKLWSLSSLSKRKSLSWKEIQFLDYIKKKNKITKIYLEFMNKLEESLALIDLFPRMKYLQIGSMNDLDIRLFLQTILKKILHRSNHHLRSLCFCMSKADDQMVTKIQKLIDVEKLIFDYTIKRICDKIYLKWK